MTIELQKLVDGVWYTYGKYDMSNKHDNSAYGEAVSQLTKYFEIRTNVLYTPEEKIADIKANCDLAIEGRDLKITELEAENNKLLDVINNQDVKIADLEKDKAYLDESLDRQIQATLDLQKENKELKSELTKKADTNHSLVEQMADLENENAELKSGCGLCYSRDKEKLAQAKDLIKRLCELVDFLNEDNVKEPVIKKAEQFLKEIEK